MIRVVTLDEFDPEQLKKLCRQLYTAFGVGTEVSAQLAVPDTLKEPYDAAELLQNAPSIKPFRDDKVLYLTQRKLKDRVFKTGTAPTQGYAQYGGTLAVLTTHPKKSLEDGLKTLSRYALHQIGHLWELHHCLDPRCAMYPTWTPSFPQGEPIFCTFCRDKSDSRIRLTKS